MKILIVGLGYAGNRFLNALRYIENTGKLAEPLAIAYVDKGPKKTDLAYFRSMDHALNKFKPHIIIVTVNDDVHADILNQLHSFKGFVICEKPLANRKDDLKLLESNLAQISGFCFDLIERYSEVSIALRDYISQHKLSLIRAHFHWGKDRINDYRPTCGVASEVIHALDLIQYVTSSTQQYQIDNILSTCSDFSISGTKVLDSAMIAGYLDKAVITGYSSFVNIIRKREIDLTFRSADHKLIFAHMIFDTPEWDIDYLKVWERTSRGEQIHLELHTDKAPTNASLQTIKKLTSLVEDVLLFVQGGQFPKQAFPDLSIAIHLQTLLNSIETITIPIGPVQYVLGSNREFSVQEEDLERLG